MVELIYPELSYKIVGILFKVDIQIGYGHRESLYQAAITSFLKDNSIPFKEQLKSEIKLGKNSIKRYYLDFLIDNKIVLEIKAGDRFNRENISQVYDYLKAKNLNLGIIANFTKQGVKFKRIIYKY
ncbi:MAG: GxxExxY protein [Patescibacteria group bacterium]|nr:GxxExxY protein [Patescibacteria group bacterium]